MNIKDIMIVSLAGLFGYCYTAYRTEKYINNMHLLIDGLVEYMNNRENLDYESYKNYLDMQCKGLDIKELCKEENFSKLIEFSYDKKLKKVHVLNVLNKGSW